MDYKSRKYEFEKLLVKMLKNRTKKKLKVVSIYP